MNFGLTQAQDYLNGLHERFGNLSQQPSLGRKADQLAPQLRRYEYRSHVVFYVQESNGVVIVRVLHRNMDAPMHFI